MSLTKERNYGIDFLRIIAMFMIATLHVLGHGGILANTKPFSINYHLTWFLEIIAYCAVNCYALISGYVGVDSKYKISNIVTLWLQVLLYSTGITILVAIIRPGSISLSSILNSCFPVMTGQYWYFTAYFGFFILLPFLNKGIQALEKKEASRLLLGLIIFFSILPTLFYLDSFNTNWGYSVLWLSILYIIGACIKKFGFFTNRSPKYYLLLYFIAVLTTWLGKFGLECATYFFSIEIKAKAALVSYTSPLILSSAILLLLFFSTIKLNDFFRKLINFFAPSAFGVYLIHDHSLFRYYIIKDRFTNYASYSPIKLLFAVLFTVLVIYLFCSILDLIRIKIFKALKIKHRLNDFENTIIK